jgi:hypothetical protein
MRRVQVWALKAAPLPPFDAYVVLDDGACVGYLGLGDVPGKTAVRRCREESGKGRAGREVVPANPSRPTGAGRLAGAFGRLLSLTSPSTSLSLRACIPLVSRVISL